MSPAQSSSRKVRGTSAITVPVGLPEVRERDKTKRYWMGTMPGSPIQNITAGGQTFQRFRGTPVFDGPNGESDTPLVYGIETDLTEEQVQLVMAGVRIRIIRIESSSNPFAAGEDAPDMTPIRHKTKRARVYMRDSKNYEPSKTDEPLAKYVYFHDLDQMTAAELRDYPPRNMVGEQETAPPESVLAMLGADDKTKTTE